MGTHNVSHLTWEPYREQDCFWRYTWFNEMNKDQQASCSGQDYEQLTLDLNGGAAEVAELHEGAARSCWRGLERGHGGGAWNHPVRPQRTFPGTSLKGDPWYPASVFNCLVMSLEHRWNVNRVGGCSARTHPRRWIPQRLSILSFIQVWLSTYCAPRAAAHFLPNTQKAHTPGFVKPRKVSSVPWGISFSSLEPSWTLECLDFIYSFTVWRISE